MNFPNLEQFNCSSNQLTSLPTNMNFPNLWDFNCNNNFSPLVNITINDGEYID